MSRVALRQVTALGRCLAVGSIALCAIVVQPHVGRTEQVAMRSSKLDNGFMRVYGQATAPYGWVQFCRSNPSECREWRQGINRMVATRATLNELDTVNRAINAAIEPATDLEVYGVTEYWTLPVTRGDCEDYALLKRKVLIERGWPAAALPMTVVRDETGEGHAVLTARTSAGDYVLDNKVQELKLWSQTPYSYVMRQSYLNPNVWVSLEPIRSVSPDAIAGVRPSER